MDTRKKPRSADAKQRSRSNTQARPASAKRPEGDARRREQPQRRPEERKRSAEQPKRRPEQAARRTEQTARRPEAPAQRNRDSESAARRQQAAAQNTADVVFKMDGRDAPKQRSPRDPAEAKRAEQRRRSAKRSQERKKQASRRSKAPKVVYTQPRPINVNRLLLQLAIVMAVVLAIVLGLSVFFKVDKVMVYGNNAYSAWAVQEAAGIEGGENLLTFGRIRASGKIKTALPYVDTVRIGINLPDTVNIYITEFDVVYAIQSQNDTWWLMTSGGRVVEQTDGGTASSYTKVLGVQLDNPVAGEQGKAYEQALSQADSTNPTDSTDAVATEAPVTVTAGDRLNAALSILDSLEANDLVGEAASVDVTNLSDIELWYGTRYKVRLGDTQDMDYKISCMKQAIAQLGEYEMGILDVSFTTWTDQPGYTPFE